MLNPAHFQLERESCGDVTAFINTTCLHMFCNTHKKKKRHPSPLQKNTLLACRLVQSGSHIYILHEYLELLYEWSLVIIEKWKH